MFDVGSYRSAVSVLEGNNDINPRMAPRPAPRAAPRTRQRPPPTYESATRRERGTYSYGDQDHDWLSVPINGENGQHTNVRSHRSQDFDDGWTPVRKADAYQPRREYRVNSYQNRAEYGDATLPLSNGVNSMSIGSRQPPRSMPQRRSRDVESIHVNGSSRKYDDSYLDDKHRSTGNLSYNGDTQRQPRGRTSYSRVTNGNSFGATPEWEETDQRSSTRVIYSGEQDPRRHGRSFGAATRAAPEERQFLSEVQQELEFQRENWKGEIDKLTGSVLSGESSSQMAMKSSYVDTSGIEPCFKAFIDIREFPASSVTVNVDKLSDKIIVEAKQSGGVGSIAKTFTQKVQMPRFADVARLTARMNRDGILKVEVPLMYYFPQEEISGDKTKSFVYEVRENTDGTKTMEILVKPGKDVGIEDLRVGLDSGKLIVYAERITDSGKAQRQTIKKYTLPDNADIDGISSNPTRDGCLTILVPILDKYYR